MSCVLDNIVMVVGEVSLYSQDTLRVVACVAVAYLLGAIPFGYIVGRMNGIDIREYGSHNIGATNVMRVLGKRWGLTVFSLDVLKGFLPVFFVWLYKPVPIEWVDELAPVMGICAIVGHTFTCFLSFKGGKGAATALGVVFGLSWLVGVLTCLVWLLTLRIWRYVSLASILGTLTVFAGILLNGGGWASMVFAWSMGILVIAKHKSNIMRIIDGTEPKVGKQRK